MSGEECARPFCRVLGRRLVVFEPVAEIVDAENQLSDIEIMMASRINGQRTPQTLISELSWITEGIELVRIRFTLLALLLAPPPSPAFAQSEPISTARMSLAVGRLASVVDMPLFFRL
jgi:hypothetical protein